MVKKLGIYSISDVLAKIDRYAKITGSPYLNCREAARLIGKSHTWLWTHMCEGNIETEMLKNEARQKNYRIVKIGTLRTFVKSFGELYKKPLSPIYPDK